MSIGCAPDTPSSVAANLLPKQMNLYFPFVFNLFLFGGFAFAVPFLVLYYQSLGFNGAQIGLLTGFSPLVTLISAPLWTSLADATRCQRLILSVALLVGAVTVFSFSLFNAFLPILLLAVLFSAAISPVTSFADSATMFMLAERKEMYGRVRLGGTIGFGLAASIAGVVVQDYGLKAAFWGSSVLLFLSLVVSQTLVHSQLKAGTSHAEGPRALLTNPRWLLFLMVAFAGGLGFSATNNYFFPYMQELGANETTMGLALTIGTIVEIPVLFWGNRLIRWFKPSGLLMLAMVITGVRLMLFAVAGTPELVLVLQLFGGLTFPAMWLAGVAHADQHAPVGRSSTAQGLFGSVVFGFGPAVGGFIGGPLLESIGGRGTFFIFGLAVLVTLVIVAFLQKRLPPEPDLMAESPPLSAA